MWARIGLTACLILAMSCGAQAWPAGGRGDDDPAPPTDPGEDPPVATATPAAKGSSGAADSNASISPFGVNNGGFNSIAANSPMMLAGGGPYAMSPYASPMMFGQGFGGGFMPYGYPAAYGGGCGFRGGFGGPGYMFRPYSTPIPPGRVAGNWAIPTRMQQPAAAARPRRNPVKARDLLMRGDRLFRSSNLVKARERFEQAYQADPTLADTLVHLGQIEMIQGRYADAAQCFRDALEADEEWIFNAPDIKAMYVEPADFDRQIAKLESYLQTEPDDRDAWLVLGVEKYLSGKTKQAADIFLRLSERRSDPTLHLLILASTPQDDPPAKRK